MPRNRRRRLVLGKQGVAAVPPAFQAAGAIAAATGSSSASVAWPAHEAGDIGLLLVETPNNIAGLVITNWDAVPNGDQGVGTANGFAATRLQCFTRRALNNAEANASVSNGTFIDHRLGVILTFRGCVASGNPVNISAGDASTDADASAVVIPGATTTVAQCLVVAICSRQTDSVTAAQSGEANADLTGVAERFDAGSIAGNGGGFSVITGVKATAGPYGATTATLAPASRQARVSLALLPA